MTPISSPRLRAAWDTLEAHHAEIADRHLREFFAEDPGRGQRLRAEAEGIYLDYSKNRVTDETVRLLLDLAVASGLADRRIHTSESLGLPTLMLESDIVDPRAVSKAQMKNRADAFFEGLIGRQQKLAAGH